MKKIFKLYRLLQKNSRTDDGKSSLDSNAFLSILILAALCGGLAFVTHKYADYIFLLGEFGIFSSAGFIIIALGVMAAVLMIFFGVMRLINSMYMSSDIEVLITMPFSAMQIAMLRVFAFFQLALLATFAATLCACIGYASVYPLTLNEWIAAVATAILLPVFVVSIVAALVVLLMSFLRIFQSREVLKVIGIIVLFILFCGYMFFSGSKDSVDAQAVIGSSADFLQKYKYIIPVLGFCFDFLAKGSILYLLLELVVTAAAFLVFFLIARALYLHGAMSMQDAGKGKILTDADLDRCCQKKPVMKALMAKEFYMVRRNTTYLLYNFIIGALWPILVVIAFRQVIPMISEILTNDNVYELTSTFNLHAFAIFTTGISFTMLFIANIPLSMQTIAYSSISREGRSFPIMKQIPVSYKVQLEAKRRVAARISMASVLIYTALMLIAASVLLKFSVLYCIIPFIMVALNCELQVDMDMMLGIKNANINWDDEKTAAKKKTGSSLLSLVGFFLSLFLGLGILIAAAIELFTIYICLAITLAYGAIMFILILILRRRIPIVGEKKIRRLRF